MKQVVANASKGGANAVLMHKGIVRIGYRGGGKDLGLILHLSASTNLAHDPDQKVQVAEVNEALKLGADAVSLHINVGSETESTQLQILGKTAKVCDEWGIPLLAMVYPRGVDIKDPYNVDVVKHAARIGAELGADIIKTNYTGDPSSFKEVVRGCPVPVVMAGGPKTENDEDFCNMVYESILAGGAGVAAGRNVFQHEDPVKIIRVLNSIVHQDLTPSEALERFLK
jgi:fructose-bisphosphate aldolase/2-amino-3,7-dideoxy-D-threo-hept-6-ulosonate synthase